MKKFSWKKLLALVLVFALALTVFAACNKEEEPDDSGKTKHEHTWATEWTSDATNHWHKCTQEGCKAINGKAKHDFDENGKCKVCGYTKTASADELKQAAIDNFFDTMFASADQIGKTEVVINDGTTHIKLGVGLDLALEEGAKIDSSNALNLDILAEALIDHKNVTPTQVEEKQPDGTTKSVTKYEATAENKTAARVAIKEGEITLLEAYYEYNSENTGVVYLTLGGNKVAIDLSTIDSDVKNVENIVVNAIVTFLKGDGVADNKDPAEIIATIAKIFGNDFSLNKLLNKVLEIAGLNLKELLSGEVGNMISGVLGMDPSELLEADGSVRLEKVLKGAGGILFTVPTWNGEAITKDTDMTVEGDGRIAVALDEDPLAMVAGGIAILNGADVALGFTKQADAADVVGRIDSFYIDAKIPELGTTKKDLALRITIDDLVLDQEGFEYMKAEDKTAYSDTLKVAGQFDVTIPENAVELDFKENGKYKIAGESSFGGATFTIPGKVSVEFAAEFSFVEPSKTHGHIEAKAGNEVVAKAHVYYDEATQTNVAEAIVYKTEYMTLASAVYSRLTGLTDFGWFMPATGPEDTSDDTAPNAVKFSATANRFYRADDANAPEDAFITTPVTLVDDFMDYTDVNAAMKAFQTSGKIKVTGINVYNLLFPREGTKPAVNYKEKTPGATGAAEEQPAAEPVDEWKSAIHFEAKDTGIFGIIGDFINIKIDQNSQLTLTIGADDLMGKLFDNDYLFTVTDKNDLKYADAEENEYTSLDQMLWYWARPTEEKTYTDKDGNPATKKVTVPGQTWEKIEAHWNEVLADINGYITDQGTVKELTVKDIRNADAHVTITTKTSGKKVTEVGVDVTATWSTLEAKVTGSLKVAETVAAETAYTAEEMNGAGVFAITTVALK